jgi:hypothetical protein
VSPTASETPLPPTPTQPPTPDQTDPPEPASFDITLATLSNTSIAAGETATVALRIENDGDRGGTYETDLLVDGDAVASEQTYVAAGAEETLVFERRFEEPGEYAIAVEGASLGTLTVTGGSDNATATAVQVNATAGGVRDNVTATPRVDRIGEGTGSIDVVDATVPADWVREGFTTTVIATVVNTVNRTANRTLTVTVGDRRVATRNVTLRPNERDVVTLEFEPVSGTVAVEGVDAGRIEVRGTSQNVGTDDDDTAGGAGPGFGLTITVLVVIGAILAAVAGRVGWRRR